MPELTRKILSHYIGGRFLQTRAFIFRWRRTELKFALLKLTHSSKREILRFWFLILVGCYHTAFCNQWWGPTRGCIIYSKLRINTELYNYKSLLVAKVKKLKKIWGRKNWKMKDWELKEKEFFNGIWKQQQMARCSNSMSMFWGRCKIIAIYDFTQREKKKKLNQKKKAQKNIKSEN